MQVLTQARPELIQRTFEALKGVRRAIVHLYNSTSVVQREKVFQAGQGRHQTIAVKGAQEVLRCSKLAPGPTGISSTRQKASPAPRWSTPWKCVRP